MIEEPVVATHPAPRPGRRRRLRRGVRRGPAPSTSATFDDGKVEELRSGREPRRRRPGRARRDHRVRAHRRSLRDGSRRGRRRPRPPRRSAGGPGRAIVAADAPRRAAAARGRDAARGRWRRRARSSCSTGPTTRRAPRATPIRQVTASYADGAGGSSSPTPTVCSPRTTRCARASWSTASRRRHRDADRHGGARAHGRLRVLRRAPARGHRADRRGRALSASSTPGPRRAARCPVVLKRGAGGVLFHEACGHGLEADLVDRDASVFRGRVGEQVASPRRHAGRRRHARPRVGRVRDRRRRRARAAQRAHRGRRAHRLHVGSRARPQGGPREQRQRPARDVPAPADGADDEHVPHARRPRTRTTSSARRRTASTASRSAAAR